MVIRSAEEGDLRAITEIYNGILTHSTAIYSDTPSTIEERIAWWRERQQQNYPVLVAEAQGEVVGFASFGDFRSWPGYRFTVEGTVHLRPGARRRGTGTLLLQELILHAKALGKHMLIAGVDSENLQSLEFLQKAGFERCAHLHEIGYKFGRYLDLILLQYRLS
jgi:phosphinothricin acetyltransferase